MIEFYLGLELVLLVVQIYMQERQKTLAAFMTNMACLTLGFLVGRSAVNVESMYAATLLAFLAAFLFAWYITREVVLR